MIRFQKWAVTGAMLCVGLCLAANRASAISFTIDEANSFLSIAVGAYDTGQDPPVFVSFTTPQAAGSDTTTLFGNLNVAYSGSSLTFTGGSNIGFALQPTDMSPLPGGALGSAPASYGLVIDLEGAVAGPGAVRDAIADITSASAALVGTTFDASLLTVGLTAGSIDVNLTGFTTVADSLPIGGNSGPNSNPNGSFVLVGDDATLTIPIYVEATVPVEVAPGFVLPLVAIFEGQIVATAQVPEPSSLALAGVGLVSLGLIARRRLVRRK